jgi:hypothetical protein
VSPAKERAALGREAAHAKTDPTLRSISQATGAAPVLADALRRSPWRAWATLSGYSDEREGDELPPTPPLDREAETEAERAARRGYWGAGERPERFEAHDDVPDTIV